MLFPPYWIEDCQLDPWFDQYLDPFRGTGGVRPVAKGGFQCRFRFVSGEITGYEKGGTALSVGYVTKRPILYLGTGQEYNKIEPFDKQKFIWKLGLDD